MVSKKFSYSKENINVFLFKKLDNILGKRLIKFLPSVKNKNINEFRPNQILLIRPGGIGDAVLLIPAIKFFKRKFPFCKIDILCEKRNSGVFKLLPYVNKIFFYHRLKDILMVLLKKYDAVIDTEQYHYLSAIFCFFIRSTLKIGFATNERKKIYHKDIYYSQDDYEVFSFLNLFRTFLKNENRIDLKGFLSIENRFINLSKNISCIGIFPGATIKERKWPKENFRKIARWLDKRKFRVIVVGGKEDINVGNYIVEGTKNGINMAGNTTLKETAEILSRCKLLLTSDSGIMHLAIAVGTPVVALFGAGIEKKWAPRDGKSIIINKHLSCSPCTQFGYTPPCPNNVRCMKEISVIEVKEAIDAILDKTV